MDSTDDTIRRLRDMIRRRQGGRPKAPSPASKPASQPAPASEGLVFRRDLPHLPSPGRWAVQAITGPFVSLQQAVGGEEFTLEDGRRHYLLRQSLADLPGGWEGLCERFRCTCGQGPMDAWGLDGVSVDSPADIAFLDLETTGLGNCMVFLAGVMGWEGDGLVVRQFLARDYSEEAAILATLGQWLAPRRVLVTFNGKSFDWPMLCVRAATNGLAWRFDLTHLDLLHASRRLMRGRVPDCRLQTLERHLCHRVRGDDIPGSAIPEAYHAFVRGGNASQLAMIAKHNRLDLMTLADLMVRLATMEGRL